MSVSECQISYLQNRKSLFVIDIYPLTRISESPALEHMRKLHSVPHWSDTGWCNSLWPMKCECKCNMSFLGRCIKWHYETLQSIFLFNLEGCIDMMWNCKYEPSCGKYCLSELPNLDSLHLSHWELLSQDNLPYPD